MLTENVRYCTRCRITGAHGVEWQISSSQWVILIVLILCGVVPGLFYGVWLLLFGGNEGWWICDNCGARRASIPAHAARDESARDAIANEPPDPTW